MNLLDASVSYFLSVLDVLKLRPKALQTALELQSGRRTDVPSGMKAQLGELAQPIKPSESAFMLPAHLDFSELSFAAAKVLIALYAHSKHSRKPFRFDGTREELAQAANISSPRIVRKALNELESRKLIRVKQEWRGIQVSLLDPEFRSGVPLFKIGMANFQHLERVPAYEWYRLLLHDNSIPRETRREWSDRDSDYVLESCPFCGARKTFRITLILDGNKTGYAKDNWFCHGCRCGGDVKRLWGRLHYGIDKANWKDALTRAEVN